MMIGFRLWLVLATFIGFLFDFVSPFVYRGIGIKTVLDINQWQNLPVWPQYAEWLISGVIAHQLIERGNLRERLPLSTPGLGTATLGIAVILIAGIVFAFMVPTSKGDENLALVMFVVMAAAIKFGWILVIGQALLVLGTLRILFNLDSVSTELEVPQRPSPPTERVVAAGRPLFVRETESHEADTSTSVSRAAQPTNPIASAQTHVPQTNASASARERLDANPDDFLASMNLYRVLAADPNQQQEFFEHARSHLSALVRSSRSEQAMTVLCECLAKDAAFKPLADDILPLARLAMMKKDTKTALKIMNRFDGLNPDHPHTPDIFFLCARGLKEMGQVDVARKLLQSLLARFPDAKIALDARTLLKALSSAQTTPSS